jgi:hypothetical protein
MTDDQTTPETAEPKKRGRKPSPLSPLLREWERATAAADKARTAYDKVSAIAQRVEEAEAEEDAAYQALQDALKQAGVTQ